MKTIILSLALLGDLITVFGILGTVGALEIGSISILQTLIQFVLSLGVGLVALIAHAYVYQPSHKTHHTARHNSKV